MLASARRGVLRNQTKTFIASVRIRCLSFSLRVYNEESTDKPKKTKRTKSIDLASALKNTSRLMVDEKEIASLNVEEAPSPYPPRKIDKRYTKDLDQNVLSAEVRWAINKTNQDKRQGEKQKSDPPIHKESQKESQPKQSKKNPQASMQSIERKRKQLLQKYPTGSTTIHKVTNNISDKGHTDKFRPRQFKSDHTEKDIRARSHFISSSHRVTRRPTKHHQFINEKVDKATSIQVLQKTVSVKDKCMEQAYKLANENIPKLAHNLDRVLFSPGVHFFQDPRTRVYNFPPFLKKIINYRDFNFDAISAFQTVSKDTTLLAASNEQNKQFYSSTSSMTSTLIQFYFLLNNYHPTKVSRFQFPAFSGLLPKLPASLVVIPKGVNKTSGERIYALESDKSCDNEILLSAMGHCLEALLTTDENEFGKYKMDSKIPTKDENKPANIYNYATYGDFLMRSQLDCYDERLPGNGTFDLKTRAACSIRYNSGNPKVEENKYQIWRLKGEFESFEKEYTDLITTGALLKYAFQARIGQMDGIFVAYHNVSTFFGFQYLPLNELDQVFYHHSKLDRIQPSEDATADEINLDETVENLPSHVADTQFKMSLEIWQDLMRLLTTEMGDTAFRLVMKSQFFQMERKTRLYVSAVPIAAEERKQLQEFSHQFKTSFKEDLTAQERLENLKEHRDRLTDFNERTIADSEVTTYFIDIDKHVIDDFVAVGGSPYPTRVDADWKVLYSIHKIENTSDEITESNRKRLLDMLAVPVDTISMSYQKNFKENKENDKKDDSSELKENKDDLDKAPRTKRMSREATMKVYGTLGEARTKKWEHQDANPVVYKPKPVL